MTDLQNNKTTLSSLEVAEMLEMEHGKLLRKLEGGRDRKGYVQILGEAQMEPSEYFIKDTYLSEQNKVMPCYQFTKLGCDFIANKFTGEKGILFTAKYVKRFQEMQTALLEQPSKINPPVGEVANLIKPIHKIMTAQGSSPHMIAKTTEMLLSQFGIELPPNFVEPTYEQVVLTTTITQTMTVPKQIEGQEQLTQS